MSGGHHLCTMLIISFQKLGLKNKKHIRYKAPRIREEGGAVVGAELKSNLLKCCAAKPPKTRCENERENADMEPHINKYKRVKCLYNAAFPPDGCPPIDSINLIRVYIR